MNHPRSDILSLLMGLGSDSSHKSYYPQLQQKIRELDAEREALLNLKKHLDSVLNAVDAIVLGVRLPKDIGRGRPSQFGELEITFINQQGRRESKNQETTASDLLIQFPFLNEWVTDIQAVAEGRLTNVRRQISVGRFPHKRTFHLTVQPLGTEGSGYAVIALTDVSDTVRLQEMLVHSEKMNSIGSLAAGMAHEINNPLAGIAQNAQVILQRVNPELQRNIEFAERCGVEITQVVEYMKTRGITESLEAIMNSTRRAATIISSMLSFVRRSESRHERHALSELVDETVALAQSDFDLKKNFDMKAVRIVRDYAPMPPVMCDRPRLQQVVLNLLQNSAHAIAARREKAHVGDTPFEPEIHIALRIDTGHENPLAILELTDNGIGMDETTCNRVFEPFFTTREVGLGTGLGMSISYFIITESHKGSIQVSSCPGEGSVFTVALPINGSDAAILESSCL